MKDGLSLMHYISNKTIDETFPDLNYLTSLQFHSVDISVKNFCNELILAFNDTLHRLWDDSKQHIIMHSSGYDSRILSYCIETSKNLKDLAYVCIEPEGHYFQQLMNYWKTKHRTMIVPRTGNREEQYLNAMYYARDLLEWKNDNTQIFSAGYINDLISKGFFVTESDNNVNPILKWLNFYYYNKPYAKRLSSFEMPCYYPILGKKCLEIIITSRIRLSNDVRCELVHSICPELFSLPRYQDVKDMKMAEYVNNISLPETNAYFEKTSIDGYAFYGTARQNLGLNASKIEFEVAKRCIGLNDEWHRSDHITLPSSEIYTYSCFPCYEFYKSIDNRTRLKDIIRTLDDIGRYPSGMMRYCKTEINIEVPNVSALAAYMYCGYKPDITIELVHLLRKRQLESGNWAYKTLDKRKRRIASGEDTAHLAMMVIALRAIEDITGIETVDMTTNAQKCLSSMNTPGFPVKAIDWGPPFLYVAFKNTEDPIEKRAKTKTMELLNHPNFRVRAIAAWALTV